MFPDHTQQELDTVQHVKEEIEELREYVDRLEEHSHRRKLRLLEQVTRFFKESEVSFNLPCYFCFVLSETGLAFHGCLLVLYDHHHHHRYVIIVFIYDYTV